MRTKHKHIVGCIGRTTLGVNIETFRAQLVYHTYGVVHDWPATTVAKFPFVFALSAGG